MPGLATLGRSLFSSLGERKSQVFIRELDDRDLPVKDGALAFQYFPETLTDTKAVTYQPKHIPGGSLPIYQWTHSGERLISFVATFTADVDISVDPGAFDNLKSKGQLRRNVDVRTSVLWLRRFMLPRYDENTDLGTVLTVAPRKLYLGVSGSGLGLMGGLPGSTTLSTTAVMDQTLCIMTQCDVTWEAFFPSGMPRIATVQLAFAQIAQLGGTVTFPSASQSLDDAVLNGNTGAGLYPYPVRVKFA